MKEENFKEMKLLFIFINGIYKNKLGFKIYY